MADPHQFSGPEPAHALLPNGPWVDQPVRGAGLGAAAAFCIFRDREHLGALPAWSEVDRRSAGAGGLRADDGVLPPHLVFRKRPRLHGAAVFYSVEYVAL